jgi:hypothetical protein
MELIGIAQSPARRARVVSKLALMTTSRHRALVPVLRVVHLRSRAVQQTAGSPEAVSSTNGFLFVQAFVSADSQCGGCSSGCQGGTMTCTQELRRAHAEFID